MVPFLYLTKVTTNLAYRGKNTLKALRLVQFYLLDSLTL